MTKTLITQDFIFSGIPPSGNYNLMFIPYRGSNLLLELRKIEVLSNCTTNVGVLNFANTSFFKGCNSWKCDSLAVRSLLDANNLTDTPVSSVITIDPVSGRVSCLNLADKKLTELTSDLGSLSELKYLDIRDNKISELPAEIGYLSSLTELLADTNMLTTLPFELCYCDSLRLLSLQRNRLNDFHKEFTRLKLENLDLRHNIIQKLPNEIGSMVRLRTLHIDYNYIETLPQSITSMHLKDFSCAQNQLCMPSLEIESWLLRFDSQWFESQICE
jgi:Leucine-rich repeat (LRR) protein